MDSMSLLSTSMGDSIVCSPSILYEKQALLLGISYKQGTVVWTFTVEMTKAWFHNKTFKPGVGEDWRKHNMD